MSRNFEPIVSPLLAWYDQNRRSMSWRDNPVPYYVWVSEIMLQQTRIEAVKAYFNRFITTLPDIQSLADVEEDKLMKLWEGLGYYNRVRNMQKAAQIVVKDYEGELPSTLVALKTLPGIGDYTAGAIASICFGVKAPAVDGNVLRVTMRVSASFDDISKASLKKSVENELMEVIPKERPGDFNQAIMELGETICIPNGQPLCSKCPIQSCCVAYRFGCALEIPVKPKKKPRRIEEKTILLLECQDRYAIHQRASKGLLAGLWELPNFEGTMTKEQLKKRFHLEEKSSFSIRNVGEAKHIFSHIEWNMVGYHIKIDRNEDIINNIQEDLRWVDIRQLKEEFALPTAFRTYQNMLGVI